VAVDLDRALELHVQYF